MTVINMARQWSELLDRASDGGFEACVVLAQNGLGFLSFDFSGDEATADGMVAALAASQLFDLGGTAALEIFDHCLGVGAVYGDTIAGPVVFNGPLRGSAVRCSDHQAPGSLQ